MFVYGDNIWTAFLAVVLALLCSRLFLRNLSIPGSHTFASIDGLRGFVAFFVFLHHARFWFNYAHGRDWASAGSPLFVMFGQVSICIFFMLSGFLFTNKLLQGREKGVDWLALYCSRFLRLTPLYICMLCFLLLVVAIKTHFTLLEDTITLRSNIYDWLLFTIPGAPEINTLPGTSRIVAGVTWTLCYEWYFYFSLPVIGVLLGVKSKGYFTLWLILSCLCLFTFSQLGLDVNLLFGFAGGAFASFVANTEQLKKIFSRPDGSWIVLFGILGCFAAEPSGSYYVRLIVMSVCLAFIACGSNLFGLLTCRPARLLSTISYGIYLLHGILLYVVFMIILPLEVRITMTRAQHWLVIFCCIPVLIVWAGIMWHFVERPAIKFTPVLIDVFRGVYIYINRGINLIRRERV